MPDTKILVIGSTKHQHVDCVELNHINTVNIVDYDIVVVNTWSLQPATIKRLHPMASTIRTSFARLLRSHGDIIVLGSPMEGVDISNMVSDTNYFWCPLTLFIPEESGNTIERLTLEFSRFLSEFREWNFYYVLTNQFHTAELLQVFGPPGLIRYRRDEEIFVQNRYGRMLSGSIKLEIGRHESSSEIETGRLVLLPELKSVDSREAVNRALEDILGTPQEELPPEWVDAVEMPLVGELHDQISKREKTILGLHEEIKERTDQIASIEVFKKLTYSSGHELEDVFELCLNRCGGITKDAKYSDEEFILEYKGDIYLIECKGVGKSIARAHVVQLLGYLTKFEETEARTGKGILLGNAWKDIPLEERDRKNTVVFPDNVKSMAVSNDIALISAVSFFRAFCRFLAGELTGEAIMDRLTTSVGVVVFDDL